jgi:hypothetical protein
MGVSDGQAVSQAITNPAFINKNVNDTMPNTLGFNHPLSGPSIADIQQAVNNIYNATGVSESTSGTVYNATPNTISNGDSYEVALAILANKFAGATGHNHDGTDGQGPPIASAVGSIAASGYAPLTGAVLIAGASGAQASQSGQIIIISATGHVDSISAQGNPALTGDVVLVAGASVSLSQVGQQITIAASGGGGSGASGTFSEELYNLGLASSVAASALTLNLTQMDGVTTPATGAGSVEVGYRQVPVTGGGFDVISTTSSLSLTVPSGATLGTASGVNAYLYVYLLNNVGANEIAISGSRKWDEGVLQNTTVLNTSSDSGDVLYSTTARTGVPVRLIRRLLTNQATAGTWNTNIANISPIPWLLESASWFGNHGSDSSWARTNTALGDPTADSTSTFTTTFSRNFGTVTSALSGSDKLPGIVFNPPYLGGYEISARFTLAESSNGGFATAAFFDGTSNLDTAAIRASQANDSASVTLIGYYNAISYAAFTIKIQTSASAGTVTIDAESANVSIVVAWSVKYLGP